MTHSSLIIKRFRLILAAAMGQIRNDNILLCIALVFKDLRDEIGASQEDVYNDTNIHIGRIESAGSNLTVSTLAELLKYFNIRFSEFFKRVEDKGQQFPGRK